MVYATPVAAALVSGAFYDALGAPFYLSADKLAGDYAAVRFERELRIFREFCREGEVLDVGCSTGGFLHQLERTGRYRAVGTDVVAGALDYAQAQGIEVRRQGFLEDDYGGRRFDAVTFWAVLEHVAHPGQFLARAGELLRPGGHAIVLVPNLGSLAIRLCGVRYRYVMAEHVNYFTADTLRKLAARVPAFEVVAVRSSHFNPIVIWQDFRGRAEPVPDAERARLLRRTTGFKTNPWLRPLRWGYRAVEAALASLRLADNLVMVLRSLSKAGRHRA